MEYFCDNCGGCDEEDDGLEIKCVCNKSFCKNCWYNEINKKCYYCNPRFPNIELLDNIINNISNEIESSYEFNGPYVDLYRHKLSEISQTIRDIYNIKDN